MISEDERDVLRIFMNFKIFAVNLFVPLVVLAVIGIITGAFRVKKKESIKGELFEYFIRIWNEGEKKSKDGNQESFYRKFFDLFVQAYEYEQYKENKNKTKYFFYKVLVLFVLLSIPFLVLFLITGKEWILNDSEWNNMYLYTVILVPVIFAYLVNKYIKIRQYRETWYRHLRNRHYIEWRIMSFIKDYELLKAGAKPDETVSIESIKADFINDMSEYWKGAADVPLEAGREENIFDDFGSLFGK